MEKVLLSVITGSTINILENAATKSIWNYFPYFATAPKTENCYT